MGLFFEYLLAFYKRKRRAITTIFFLLIFLGVFLYFVAPSLFKKSLTEGVVGTYLERDLPPVVTGLLSESLINIDESGQPKPGLATSWDVNENATIYKLKLRNNLFWEDGTSLKASDLNILIAGAEVKALDDKTLEFKIVDSFSPFLTLLNKPVLKKDTLIGVGGKYQMGQIKKDGGLFIKRLTLIPKSEDLPTLVIRFYPSERIAKNALKLGEIQALLGVSDLSDLSRNNLNIFSKINYGQLVTIFYDTSDPILSDENFRLALGYASPTIKDEVEATTSLSPKSWAFNPFVKDFLDKPELAKSNLNKVQKGKDATITLTATSSLKGVGQKVVDAWKGSGIKAVLRVESGIPQNFQALLITQNIPLDPDQYSLWHSTQSETNISKVANPRIDKDLEDGRKITDMEIRKARYQDFQKVLLDNAPATFLYFPKYNVLYFKKIEEPLKKVLELQIKQI